MASSAGIARTTGTLEEQMFRGAKRSRLSFHFNGMRRRRWLLVQWVSLPLNVIRDDEDENYRPAPARPHRQELSTVLDTYQATQMLHQRV